MLETKHQIPPSSKIGVNQNLSYRLVSVDTAETKCPEDGILLLEQSDGNLVVLGPVHVIYSLSQLKGHRTKNSFDFIIFVAASSEPDHNSQTFRVYFVERDRAELIMVKTVGKGQSTELWECDVERYAKLINTAFEHLSLPSVSKQKPDKPKIERIQQLDERLLEVWVNNLANTQKIIYSLNTDVCEGIRGYFSEISIAQRMFQSPNDRERRVSCNVHVFGFKRNKMKKGGLVMLNCLKVWVILSATVRVLQWSQIQTKEVEAAKQKLTSFSKHNFFHRTEHELSSICKLYYEDFLHCLDLLHRQLKSCVSTYGSFMVELRFDATPVG
ncbi:MAG: hypothetical protein NZT61_07725 [Deltaproteobacteria bacterium]|nr:hypothetical protein [Deltaproteobacteria bacterium]MCX7952923.1 hypothetical protein [Deltaproteobacteria bacterium]